MTSCSNCGAPIPDRGPCRACHDGLEPSADFEPLVWPAAQGTLDDDPIEGEPIGSSPPKQHRKLALAAMTAMYPHLEVSALEAPTPPPIALPDDHPLARELAADRRPGSSPDPLDNKNTDELMELALEVSRWSTPSRYEGTLRSRLVKEERPRRRWVLPLAVAGATLVALLVAFSWPWR